MILEKRADINPCLSKQVQNSHAEKKSKNTSHVTIIITDIFDRKERFTKVTSAFQSRYILLIQGRLRFRTSSTRVPQRIFDNRLSSLFFDELG